MNCPRLHTVSVDQILLGDGSGEILKLSAAAFTSKDRKLIIPNPTFEAIARHAAVAQAEVVKIDLTSDYRHDLQKMLAAANGAGLIYICNPNNPNCQHYAEERDGAVSRKAFPVDNSSRGRGLSSLRRKQRLRECDSARKAISKT
jgi:histidinol-phosphate/aromatic aminotransferase/cobyric acid decarboxylase-like protein